MGFSHMAENPAEAHKQDDTDHLEYVWDEHALECSELVTLLAFCARRDAGQSCCFHAPILPLRPIYEKEKIWAHPFLHTPKVI